MKKICTKCNRNLDASRFNKRHNTRDGLAYYCKDCVKSYLNPKEAVNGADQLYKKLYKQGLRRSKIDCVVCNKSYTKPYRVILCRDCYDEYLAPWLEKNGTIGKGEKPIYRLVGGTRFVFDRMSTVIPAGFFGDNSFPKREPGYVTAATAKKVFKAYTESPEGVKLLVQAIKDKGGEEFLREALSG